MKITEIIEVQSDPGSVWNLFENVPELALCLPGAELTEARDDGSYAGRVTAKLGPMSVTFEGEATVESDVAARSGSVLGKGVDKRGGSMGRVEVRYALAEIESGTQVTVDADVVLSGAAAQFGRTGLIKEMSRRLIGEFVQCVEAKLAAETAQEASAVHAGEVKGIRLFLASVFAPIGRLFRRLFGRNPPP